MRYFFYRIIFSRYRLRWARQMTLRHRDSDGRALHAFLKTTDGRVKVRSCRSLALDRRLAEAIGFSGGLRAVTDAAGVQPARKLFRKLNAFVQSLHDVGRQLLRGH